VVRGATHGWVGGTINNCAVHYDKTGGSEVRSANNFDSIDSQICSYSFWAITT
jgi:hypothetical protein